MSTQPMGKEIRDLTEARLRGAWFSSGGSAPFSRGPAVLSWPENDDVFVVCDYTLDGRAVVDRIERMDWDQMVQSGESLEFRSQSASAFAGAAIWALRAVFPNRQRAIGELQSGALVRHSEPLQEAIVCAVEEPRGLDQLDAWARQHFDAAYECASLGRWDAAHLEVLTAWTLDRLGQPEYTALYAVVLRSLHRASEAEDVIVVEGQRVDEARIRKLELQYAQLLGAKQMSSKRQREPHFTRDTSPLHTIRRLRRVA